MPLPLVVAAVSGKSKGLGIMIMITTRIKRRSKIIIQSTIMGRKIGLIFY
jgi:hypothetical protein